MRTLRIICVLCCLALPGVVPVLAESKPPGLPTWPQAFTLAAGEHATFIVPITAAGAVTAKATWEGVPVSLTLTDLQGKTLASVESKPSPATLTYTMTTADLARGPLYCLVLSTTGNSKPSPNAKAKGSVTVTSPEVDPATLTKAVNALQQLRASERKALESKTPTPSGTKPLTVSKARQAKITEQDRVLLAKFKALSAALPPNKLAIKPVLSPEKTATKALVKPATPKAPSPGPKGAVKPLDTTPTILSITPKTGSFDDTVTLTCLSLVDPAKCEVVFTSGTSGTGIRATQTAPPVVDDSSGEQQLTVIVPNVLAMTALGTIAVTVVDKGRTPSQTSKPVDFSYDPTAPPVITSVTPMTVKIGDDIKITGKRLLWAGAHLIVPGQGDQELPVTHRMGTEMTVTPAYQASEALSGQLYLVNKANRQSEPVVVSITPTQSSVARIEPAECKPGESVLITGTMLANVKDVFMKLQPKEKQTAKYIGLGNLAHAVVEQRSDNALLIRIPENLSGDRIPGLYGGFSDPIAVTLEFQGVDKRWVTVPITITPVYVKVRLRIDCDEMTTTFQPYEADDLFMGLTPVQEREKPTAWFRVARHSSLFTGHKGTDTFSVSKLVVCKDYNVTFHSATIDVSGDGTSLLGVSSADAKIISAGLTSDGRPTVTVHWWVDAPNRKVFSYLSYLLRCPKGVWILRNPADPNQGRGHTDSDIMEEE